MALFGIFTNGILTIGSLEVLPPFRKKSGLTLIIFWDEKMKQNVAQSLHYSLRPF
jgi:hypothetical protein